MRLSERLIPAVFIICLAGPITAEALLRAICPQSQEVRIIEVLERSSFETADGLAEARDDSAACMECRDGTTGKAIVLNGNDPNAGNRFADTAMGCGRAFGPHERRPIGGGQCRIGHMGPPPRRLMSTTPAALSKNARFRIKSGMTE